MENLIIKFQKFLEKIDDYRDKVLFWFIKPLWPKKIISPNTLSYVRIIIGCLLAFLLFYMGVENKIIIISLFVIGIITDLFDGSVARAFNITTDFGAMLDPIADRILILPIAVYSLYSGHKWLLLIIFSVELIGALISMLHKSKETDVKANIFGKSKMVLVSIVFFAILIYWPNEPNITFINILWVSIIFSILSVFVRIIDMNSKGFIKNQIINKQIIKKNEKKYKNI